MNCNHEQMMSLAQRVGRALAQRGQQLTCAESCTGGGMAYYITTIAGSSAWFDRGFVTYSNEAKQDLLQVDPAILTAHGAVSEPTAAAMTTGALLASRADLAVATTGIAGPGGGSAAKPVGTVFIAWQRRGQPAMVQAYRFVGNREQIRLQTIGNCFDGLLRLLNDN